MKPIVIIDIENHQYKVYLNDNVKYIDFTKSNQIEIIINEMIEYERDKKINKLLE